MAARPSIYQVSCNAGEIDPNAHGNTGLKAYYAALARAERIQPVPQGGFDLLPGSRARGRVRRETTIVAQIAAASYAGIAASGVIATYVLAAPVSFAVLDLINASSTVTLGMIFTVEARRTSDSGWFVIGGGFSLRAQAETRRIGLPPRQPVTIDALRISLSAAPSGATDIAFQRIDIRSELTTGLPVARETAFTFSREQAYMAVLTGGAFDGNIDFYDAATKQWTGCAYIPLRAVDLGEATALQRADTMLLFHKDRETYRIRRRGANYAWQSDAAPFEKLPDVDYGGDYVDTAEVWEIHFQFPSSGYTIASTRFVLSVDGEETAPIDWDVTPATLAADIKAALETLENVEAGIVVAHSPGGVSAQTWTVTFAGEGNAGGQFAFSGRIVNTTQAALTTSRTTRGKPGGEPVASATRGYARTGAYYQDRLILGGFRSKASAALLSRTGEYFDFNTLIENAAGALLINLDTDGAENITHLAQARHLVIFTDEAHYFVADRAISRTQPPNIVRSERLGASAQVPVVEQEGALIFVNRERSIVYAAQYSDVAQAYESQPLSLLSSHLILGIADLALQRASSATDAERLWLVRDDGLLVCGNMIRNQEITGFVRWPTQGSVRAVRDDGNNTPWLLVERVASGETDLFIETLEDDLLFDGAVTVTAGTPFTNVTGADMHNGQPVWADADGYILGPFTPQAGAFELPFAASAVTFGRWTAPLARTMPLPRNVAERIVVQKPARIHQATFDLINTQSIAVGANNGRVKDQPLAGAGDDADAAFAGFTGRLRVDGLAGYSDDAMMEITQTRPGQLHLRNWSMAARL